MASSRWSAKEFSDFINLLSKVERNIIGMEDIQDIALKMKTLGYKRDTDKYHSKFGELKRNHQNSDACKVINDIVAKEKVCKKSKMMSGLDSDDDDHGPGEVNDQELDDVYNISPSTSSCRLNNTSHSPELHHFLDVNLEEENRWQHPMNTAKKPKIATSLQSSLEQNPQGTNSSGASTSENLKRPSGQQPQIFKDKSDMVLNKLLEEKDWTGITMFLEICPSLSHEGVKAIAKLAIAEGQLDVVKICSLKLQKSEVAKSKSSKESHDQE